jgi:hypothetical protein
MWIAGTRTGGAVERIGETRVESQFAHLNFLPFVPAGSYLVLGSGHVVPIGSHAKSIFAGYARGWGWLASLGTFYCASRLHDPLQTVACIAGFAVAGAWMASFRFGALSSAEIARRRVFAKVIGYPVDPFLLTRANPSLAEHLVRDLETRAEALAPDGYRGRRADWRAACEAPGVDASFLAIALTATRIGVGRGDARDRMLCDLVWKRLEGQLGELPERIEPLTRVERIEERREAPAQVAPPAPVEVLPSRRGDVIDAGWDVTARSKELLLNGQCASCLAPTNETKRSTLRWLFTTTSVDIPTCRSCRAHAIRNEGGRGVILFTAVLLAFSFAAIGFVPSVSLAVTLVVAAVMATLAVVAIPLLQPPRRALPPATMGATAARLVRADRGSVTVHCTNRAWAESIAASAGTELRAKRRLFSGAFNGLLVIPLAVQPVALGAFWLAHPEIRVDNGTGTAIRVWVDGEDKGVIEPTAAKATDLASVRSGWGSHTFEWAPIDRPNQKTKVTSEIEIAGTHLWDPGRTHCYWRTLTVYGDATSDGAQTGPRPRTELYGFPKIDEWFVESPHTVQTKESGQLRYSLQRDLNCPSVAHCGKAAVDKYWDCMQADGEPEGCKEVATELCDK